MIFYEQVKMHILYKHLFDSVVSHKIYLHPVLIMYVMFVIPFALTPKTLKTIRLCSVAITRVEVTIVIIKASVYAQNSPLSSRLEGHQQTRMSRIYQNHSLSTAVGFHT